MDSMEASQTKSQSLQGDNYYERENVFLALRNLESDR